MPVVAIDDLADPRLVDFAHHTDVDLRRGTGLSSRHGIYLAESLLVLERGLRAGHVPRAVLALGASVDEVLAVLGDRAERTPVFTGSADLLAQLTGYLLHRGVVASMNRPPLPQPAALLEQARRIVVVENVADPTNVGAIFRSVAGIGADAVLVTERCSDPFYRRAIRVSMGTVLQVPWTRAPDWPELGRLLHDAGFTIAALARRSDAVALRDFAANAPEKVALVVGAEAEGLTPEALAAADTVVEIPMRHGVDSLNVAAAAAVAIYALA